MNIVVASLEFKSHFGLSLFKQDSLSIDIPFSLRPAACPTGQAEHLLLLLLLLLLLYNSLSVGVLSLHLRLFFILGHKFSVRQILDDI